MSADLLRRAAVALRQHAQDASPGPWSFDGNPSCVVVSEDSRSLVGTCYNWPAAIDQANARFIALLGPPVALALADALEQHVVETYDDLAPSFQAFVAGEAGGDPDPMVTLAREILREPKP